MLLFCLIQTKAVIGSRNAVAIAVVAFVAASFVSSPELRAWAAKTITSADIENETILSEDIRNGQVKSADLAANSVGARELKGVTKLVFAKCTYTNDIEIPSFDMQFVFCNVTGAEFGDQVMASITSPNDCWVIVSAFVNKPGEVEITTRNACQDPASFRGTEFAILLYRT